MMWTSSSWSPVVADAVGVLQQQPPPGERGHAGAQDLPVERVGQHHLLAASLGPHRELPRAIQGLQLVAADDRLQRGQAGGLTDGEDLQGADGRRPERAEASGDQLLQSRRGDERTDQPPHAAPVGQVTALDRAQHQLADEQDVALAGRVQISVTVPASTGPPRTRCSSVSTAARSRYSRSMRRTRARCHSESTPGGTASLARTVADQEHEVGVDELADERR